MMTRADTNFPYHRITALFITQVPKALFQQRRIGNYRNDDIHIDGWFGSHSRDGGASNALDRDSYIAHGRPVGRQRSWERVRLKAESQIDVGLALQS
jgi:hypothetical protein